MSYQKGHVYEGQWDCHYCGHKGLSGPKTHCTQCGGARISNVQFYLPDDSEAISDEDKLEQANAGPNWNCSNCDSTNEHWDQFCGSCGSPFREDDKDTILAEKSYDLDAIPNSSEFKPEPVKVKQAKKLSGKKKTGIFATISAAIFAFLSTFSSSIDVDVVGHEWQRVIYLQAYKQVSEEGWKIPSGGKQVSSFRSIHHYNQEFMGYETRTRTIREKVGQTSYVCGKTDLGNGYFRDRMCQRDVFKSRQQQYQEKVFRSVPVYATKYRYLIYRWADIMPITTEGNDHQPKWGTRGGIDNKKNFRITRRAESYFVQVKDHKGELHRERFPLAQWETFDVGDKLPALKSTVYGYYKELDREKINKALLMR